MNDKPDQSFDSILNKFKTNIYGSSKGKLRHEILLHFLEQYVPLTGQSLYPNQEHISEQPLDILDVGAGTGIMSREMLSRGHKITFNDISTEAMENARCEFNDCPDIKFIEGNLNELTSKLDSHIKFDVVMCHAVLEWLQNPYEALTILSRLVKENGILSVSFFNLDAHRFGNVLYGNFDYVLAGMPRKNTVRLNPNNALAPKLVLEKIKQLPFSIEHTAGLRCFHDYLNDREKQIEQYDKLKALELQYADQEPYKWLGKYFHIIARRSA